MQKTNDPITLEIIQNSLQATADEMFAVMKKTAMSSIIYEVLDVGTGITDAAGELVSSGAGIPTFVHRVGDHGTREEWDAAMTASCASYPPAPGLASQRAR